MKKTEQVEDIIAQTLREGIGVKDLRLVFPGYSGQIIAPFNESTEGNPVYKADELMGIEAVYLMADIRVSIRSSICGPTFVTPDGMIAITSCGRFNTLPWHDDYCPWAAECGEEFDFQEQRGVPALLNNIYRALFSPDMVPSHWNRIAVAP